MYVSFEDDEHWELKSETPQKILWILNCGVEIVCLFVVVVVAAAAAVVVDFADNITELCVENGSIQISQIFLVKPSAIF